ncbi:EamA family transporter [Aquincola sp. MAHUQ-54]|uniref:EamA family transporter n=1 Tax=Aquincola agrisoli TaxID=3119538 RepID=A0AAW9Q7E5_9BURK
MLTLVWGTNWPLFAMAVQEVSVWTFRAVSVVISGVLLLLWSHSRGESLRIPRRYWLTTASAALVYLGVWNVASTYAAVLIPSGQAAVLGFTMPLWAAMGAHLFLRQRLDRRALAALALGGSGVLLLGLIGWDNRLSTQLGFALGLLAAIGWACGTLLLKRFPVPVSSTVLTGWQLLCIGVPLGTVALALGNREWFVPSWPSLAVIGYISIVPMAIGNAAWFTIVRKVPAHVAALSPVLVPVVAMVTGAVVDGDPLGRYECLAMLLCVSGVALNLKPRR